MNELQRADLVSLMNCGTFLAGMELLEEEDKQKFRRCPRYWVSPYLKERNQKGRFFTDFENLKSAPQLFSENFHMTPTTFDELYELLHPHLAPKRNTRPKDFIPTKAKLAIVLEYLASGDLQRHLASCYRISKQHFGRIIDHVCEAICTTLQNEIPRWNEDMLLKVADGFRNEWNFPNCVGAIDGKHVSIVAPANSGSIFYNYKGFHSIVVLATCDAFYKFTYLDIGAYGSEGDCNIFKNSKFGVSVVNDTCPFPPDAYVGEKKIPHFIFADDAFPLSKRMMKPYNSKPILPAQRIFNYRLSRARRCIENAFGILSAKWLCLRKTLFCSPDRAQKIISACCLLHNFLLNKNPQNYFTTTLSGFEDSDGNWVDGEWKTSEHQEGSLMKTQLAAYHGRSSDYGKYIQKTLIDYVNSATGSVPWQNKAAFL